MPRTTPAPLSAMALCALLALPASAQQAAPDAAPEWPTLAALGQDAALTAAYDAMMAGRVAPDWLTGGGVQSPTRQVGFDGATWLAMTSCKPHDCAAHRIAVVYDPQAQVMLGVLSQSSADDSGQQLEWLNPKGGQTIDGRTILFAALTGSLENHPQAFDLNPAPAQ